MLKYPEISPVIFSAGPLVLRWYGFMYAVSFFILITVMRRQAARGFLPLSEPMVERLFITLVVFILLGARLFYVLFYSTSTIWKNPAEIFALWHGGMSFHGGFAGSLAAGYWISRKTKTPLMSIIDTMSLVGPIGIFFGRIGNFINGELYGRVTTVPWGMVFPGGGPLPRHPSQLYECLTEGLLLACLLWYLKPRVKRHGIITAVFSIGYAVARTSMEFFREPDAQLGFVLGPFTMGQLLSIFAVLIPGILFLRYSLKHGAPIAPSTSRRQAR
jgi:phosphatidylglycerol:prolipoprotein diacylglycerol transferase